MWDILIFGRTTGGKVKGPNEQGVKLIVCTKKPEIQKDRVPGKRHLQFGEMVSREPGIGQVREREMIRRYRLHGRQEDFHGRHGREKERRML